jgi:hypothetical protein
LSSGRRSNISSKSGADTADISSASRGYIHSS